MSFLVKILGGIDIASAFAFLMLVFGIHVPSNYLLFCAGLLFVKSLFLIGGDILSWIDIFSSVLLILSVFFTLPVILLWISAFFLMSKGAASFF